MSRESRFVPSAVPPDRIPGQANVCVRCPARIFPRDKQTGICQTSETIFQHQHPNFHRPEFCPLPQATQQRPAANPYQQLRSLLRK